MREIYMQDAIFDEAKDIFTLTHLPIVQQIASYLFCLKRHEQVKKQKYAYGQSIREIEHRVFTPLVLSITGSMGIEGRKQPSTDIPD